MKYPADTIAAIATPLGKGGIGVVRVSGPKTFSIAQKVLGLKPKPRYAHYGSFRTSDLETQSQVIDQGIALFFPAPNSFTGEDVLELQGHGGPVILDMLLKEVVRLGSRLARPGEFSERAYLNDKLDLNQAEAIADLINASSEQAARSALHSLQGLFSQRIEEIREALIQLRIYVEAAMDFPEEEIDFFSDSKISLDLQSLTNSIHCLQNDAKQGALLREGMHVVIAGKPNAGKSSLLNALAQKDVAIVTEVEGTTRDVLKEHIHIDGMPLHIADTAGLRQSGDKVERIGMEKALDAIHKADRILLVRDSSLAFDDEEYSSLLPEHIIQSGRLTLVNNKCDISAQSGELGPSKLPNQVPVITLSAKTGEGLGELQQHLKEVMGFKTLSDTNPMESSFIARHRHLDAIARALEAVKSGVEQLQQHKAGELLAEDLRRAQQTLEEITGAFTPDDLLGRIFSSFCIGK